MASDKLTTTVSTKGQVVLPKAIRDERRWRAGTQLTIESTPDGVLLKPASLFPPAKTTDVFASLPLSGQAKERGRDGGGYRCRGATTSCSRLISILHGFCRFAPLGTSCFLRRLPDL